MSDDDKPEALSADDLDNVQGGITLDNGIKGQVTLSKQGTGRITLDNGIKGSVKLDGETSNITLDNGIKRSI